VSKVRIKIYRLYKEKADPQGEPAPALGRYVIPTARDRIVPSEPLCECLSDVFPQPGLTLPQVSYRDFLKSALAASANYTDYAKN